MEEKIKLCEGKYEAALIERGPRASAFDVPAAEVLPCRSDRLRAVIPPSRRFSGEAAAFPLESATRGNASSNCVLKRELDWGSSLWRPCLKGVLRGCMPKVPVDRVNCPVDPIKLLCLV